MSTTTIKVDDRIRDRLAGAARARRMTIGALLAEVADRLEREQRWADIEAAYGRLRRDDPAGWAEYVSELTSWEAGTLPVDATAAEEWPELNR